ncbi:MAG TPA: hypothetical protein VGF75_06855 [Candidatus Saccharimonadales bacterium]|jgi:hypothetical protein
MSLLRTETTDVNGNTTSSIVVPEIAQLVIAVALIAAFVVCSIEKIAGTDYLGGAVIAIIGYYFGGKNSTTSANQASSSTLTAATSTPTTPTTSA